MAGLKLWLLQGSVGGAGLWRLILLSGLTGFGLVGLWANAGTSVEGAWSNIVRAIGTPGMPPDIAATIVGRASVVDGDTIDIRGIRIRLGGIDAPESGQSCRGRGGAQYPCGRRAAFALSDKVGARNLACEVSDRDRYGRSVATCMLGGLDLNGWMVSSGWALAYRQYSAAYVGAEADAQAARAGIWDGEFTAPWEWRRSDDAGEVAATRPVPASASSSEQPGCTIKGNISASGERIFHVPGQEYYARTVISEAKGERWFCSEADALSAGWRAARR